MIIDIVEMENYILYVTKQDYLFHSK